MATAPRRPFFRRRKSCPFSGAERAEDRLQGHAPAVALHLRARQDRAVAHHRGFGQQAARTRPGDQARALPRPAALRHSLTTERGRDPPLSNEQSRTATPRGTSWGRRDRRPLTASNRGTAHSHDPTLRRSGRRRRRFGLAVRPYRQGHAARARPRLSRADAADDRRLRLGRARRPRGGRGRRVGGGRRLRLAGRAGLRC